jgi:hypothetical protein
VWEVPTTIIVGREKHPTSRMHTKLTLIWTPIDAQFVLECVIAIKDNLKSLQRPHNRNRDLVLKSLFDVIKNFI